METLIKASELLWILDHILIVFLLFLILELDLQRTLNNKRLINKNFIFIYIRLVLSITCLTLAKYIKAYSFAFMFFVIVGSFPIMTLREKLMKLLKEEEKKK